jgi:DNA-binding NtrC family response regulator
VSANKRILVADDEPNLRRVLAAVFDREGYEVLLAQDGAEALQILEREEVQAVIADLKMPRVDGMTLLKHVIAEYPDLPVVMITAHGTVDTAVEALKAGAFDYVTKPFEQEELKAIVAKALAQSSHNREEIQLTGDDRGRYEIIGRHPSMSAIYEIIRKVADTPSTVLINGESGTGKELIAKALHENSSRAQKPFIKINCGAIPKTLVESELFGYEKGAFTGAVGSKPGRFELAHEGTLFLDEIAEIPSEMQVKLLRVLQESEFERVGGIKTIRVDVRLVAATNRDLPAEIAAGNFREDLYYRINVVPIRLPPLRDRKSDIPLLVEHFVAKYNARLKKNISGIEPEAMQRLVDHVWAGNIRELENVIERTILFTETGVVRGADLPAEVSSRKEPLHAGGAGDATAADTMGTLAAPASLKDAVRATTERLERELIARALADTGGNVTQAAKRLKISRKSLQNKMKEFGLREEREP